MPNIPRVPSVQQFSFRIKLKAALWWVVEAAFFRPSFHHMNRWRCFLLRAFGASVGRNTFINSRAKIWFPWNLSIGDNAGIGFDALIYNLDRVEIGDFATVSQRVHINTGSHDYTKSDFSLVTRPVSVEDGVFIGADAYIGWGVRVGEMAVIGARSVVVADMPAYHVCVGHPCRPIKEFVVN